MKGEGFLLWLFCFVAPFIALDITVGTEIRACRARGGLAVQMSPWRVNCHVPPARTK